MTAKVRGVVRVVAGTLRGRILEYPVGGGFRPTMQRTKTSVFDALAPSLVGSRFVDLFASSGGIGIEALSRGASLVCFVERERQALRCLRRNLDRCEVDASRFVLHAGDVRAFIESGRLRDLRPNIVYADPPYDSTDFCVLLELLSEIVYPAPVLIVIEHPRDAALPAAAGVARVWEKSFGHTHVSMFRCEGSAAAP